nr:metal ABC transporter permease [Moraxella catarrhalis]
MIALLLEPFAYEYMLKAIFLSSLVGGVCAFLSAYLMLKGWSLIGDALSHAVVPGVAIAYALGAPYALGAFFSGILAALSILWIKSVTKLREDAVIGFIFTTFFALGLFIISLNPTAINVQEIIFGNILGIADTDMYQVTVVMVITLLILLIFWKDLLLVFLMKYKPKRWVYQANIINYYFLAYLVPVSSLHYKPLVQSWSLLW